MPCLRGENLNYEAFFLIKKCINNTSMAYRGHQEEFKKPSDRIRVAHDVNDLPEDESNGLILTLQDQPIIGGSGQTVLENPRLVADYKREFHKHIQDKLKGAHDPHDDFFRGKILAKYDEQNPEKEGFELNEQGNMVSELETDLSHLPREGVYDLNVRKEVHNDYFTPDELNPDAQKFKKRSKKSNSKFYRDNSSSQLGTGLGSKATRDFSFLRMVEDEEEDQAEMLGKRIHRPGIGLEIEQSKHEKDEKYANTMKQATENMRKKIAFAEIDNQEQEDLHMLQQMMKNNRRLAEEKAKTTAERLSQLLKKPEESTDNGEFVTLEKVETPKDRHTDLKAIIAKAKQSDDPFKPLEK